MSETAGRYDDHMECLGWLASFASDHGHPTARAAFDRLAAALRECEEETARLREQVVRLDESEDEYAELTTRLQGILIGVANSLKGPPAPGALHDWSDLVDVAYQLKQSAIVDRADVETLRTERGRWESAARVVSESLGEQVIALRTRAERAVEVGSDLVDALEHECYVSSGMTRRSRNALAEWRAFLAESTPQRTERVDRRFPACIEAWPECYSGGYDPRCCRFPKSCSCEPALPDSAPGMQPHEWPTSSEVED